MTTIAAMQARLARASASFDRVASTFLPAAATDIRLRGIESFIAVTPVDAYPPQGTQRLRDTTDALVTGTATSGSILFGQEKTISINGEAVPLWRVLTLGRAGGYPVRIINPDATPWLAWEDAEGWHHAKETHPGPAAPSPYIHEGAMALLPAARARFREAGEGMLRALVRESAS